MRNIFKVIYFSFSKFYIILFTQRKKSNNIKVFLKRKDSTSISEIERFYNDLNFFFDERIKLIKITVKKDPTIWSFIKNFILGNPVFLVGYRYTPMQRALFNCFNVDANLYHAAAWGWHRALSFIYFSEIKNDLSNKLLISRFNVKKETFNSKDKVYVLGTGPSLIEALEHNFDDGVKIVCNTVVKSDKLWNHIKPDIIVAGDAIHHFSNSKYAIRFRHDLRKRLLERSDLLFIYPQDFHIFVLHEFTDINKAQLLPILNSSCENPLKSLDKTFSKPALENVLTMLQLPIAKSISNNIYLIGYDGRKKNDIGFWKSSDEFNYLNEMNQLRDLYPAFFSYYIPEKNKSQYIEKVHGTKLERILQKHERKGYNFIFLTNSNTPSFKKRFIKNNISHK